MTKENEDVEVTAETFESVMNYLLKDKEQEEIFLKIFKKNKK